MPGHRTPIKRERDSPPADDEDDDDRHRHRRDRPRSPRDKVDKGKGRLKREKKDEKLVVVRKRIKDDDSEREPKPKTAPDWLVQIAYTILGREDRRKYKYSLEKRGGSGPGRDRDEGWYPPEKKYPKVYGGQGNAHFLVPDGNGTYRMEVDDSTGPARMRKAEAKAEELMKLSHDILEEMRREDKKRERLRMSYEKYPGFNHGAETVYERYMRTTGQSENP